MAYTETTNYDLRKHAKGDMDWHTAMNWNLDTIDAQMFANAGAASTAQSAAEAAQADADTAQGAAEAAQADADTAQAIADAKGWKKFTISATIDVTVDDTYVGDGFVVNIPANSVLHGFFIKSGVPGGTAGGTKTIDFSVGTAKNTDNDLTDGTDIDIMIESGELTAAGIHGDSASDHVAAYFPMDMFGKYFDTATDIFLNFIGKASDATANPGTVTAAITVWAIIEQLS